MRPLRRSAAHPAIETKVYDLTYLIRRNRSSTRLALLAPITSMHKLRTAALVTGLTAGSILIVLTLASLLYETGHWWLQVLNFPRLFGAVALGVCAVLFFLGKPRWGWPAGLFIAGLTAAIFINCAIIFPYTPLGPKALPSFELDEASAGSDFSIVVANVYMRNRDAEDLIEGIGENNPDAVLVLETDSWWVRVLDGALLQRYPYRMAWPADNTYGMALYSRLPLIDTQTVFLNYPDVPSFRAMVTLPGGVPFHLYAVHPVPPRPTGPGPENQSSQKKEVALERLAEQIAAGPGPLVVAGDFNDVGWSHNMQRFAKSAGLADARCGRGLYSTYNANWIVMRWPLDYVFASSQWRVGEVERLERFGSDHFPYLVRLRLGGGEREDDD